MAGEKRFEEKVRRYLKENGCWSLKYWGGGGFTRSGIPDLLVCCNGHFLGVELKGPKGRPSELQVHNLRKIDEAGGYAVLLYPEDFERFQRLVGCLGRPMRGYAADLVYQTLRSRWEHFENNQN